MKPDPKQRLVDKRLDQIQKGASEAIRREVDFLKQHNFPVWVADDGKVVDASKRAKGTDGK